MPRHALIEISALLVLVVCVSGRSAPAQIPLFPAEVQIIDVIAIERDGRNLYSFDALTGRRALIRLEIAEEVLFQRTRGRVGIVLTDRRVLGVAPGTAWLEARLELREEPADRGLVEDRIALVTTSRRALAFTGASGWISERYGPNEAASSMRAGSAAGVITTNRRALGAAPALSGFVSRNLRVREVLESVTAQDTLITLRTDKRILVFSAPRASWAEQTLQIN